MRLAGLVRIDLSATGSEVSAQKAFPLSLSASPNPFASATAFTVSGPLQKNVVLEIHDVTGRIIARPDIRATGRVAWNGADFHGRRVPAGEYFALLRSGSQRIALRMMKL